MGVRRKEFIEYLRVLPTNEPLSEAFEIPVPEFFAEMMRFFWIRADGDPERCLILFDEVIGFYPTNGSTRYQQTPPELFPFGHPGCDGVHYGWVVHVPDVDSVDYLVGEICPMDGDGVFRLGLDTRDAIESLLSDYGDNTSGPPNPTRTELLHEFKLELSPDKARNRYDANGHGRPISPKPPTGWRFLQSSDGVGVLAPAGLFSPDEVLKGSYNISAETFLEKARLADEDRFPATALYYLREGYWYHWTDQKWLRKFATEMISIYDALGRPHLGRVVSRSLREFG